MKTSCINHPANNRFSLLRQDYWDICETNELSQTARACAAKLLNVFEQWMNSKCQNVDQVKRYNKAATSEGLEIDSEGEIDLWVYESAEDLHNALISEHPIKTIRQALNWMVSQNLLLRRRNPKMRWDKTYQYMLNVSIIQERINALILPTQLDRISPQETSCDMQATSISPTGNSNTIDSFLDSNLNSEREEEAHSQKALPELGEKSTQDPIESQSASLSIKQRDSANDGEISGETVSSAPPIFQPQKNNATANFEKRFVSPQKYPALIEAGHGDIMIGTGYLDFDPIVVEVAVLHLKKHELACEVGDGKRFISNRIKQADWGAIELLKESAATIALNRKKTEAAIAASTNTNGEYYDTSRYCVAEPPVIDLEARAKATEVGRAKVREILAEAKKKRAS